jgi:2-polyprenyl-6-methoxyphenol hydroxylase-like FAD-dependent oxidoreductase
MQGIMIKRLGHNVRILEQYPTSSREGQAAGMSTGPSGEEFLAKHDHIQDQPHFVHASSLRLVDVDLNLSALHPIPFNMTNWKTLYYRLRANFDGLSSGFVQVPPATQQSDGTVLYDTGKRVQDISYDMKSGVTVTFEDVTTGISTKLHPDLVVAADGANSTIRKLLFPKLESPYSGYLAWRGIIPERNVSEETMSFLKDNAIWYCPGDSLFVV